jgi:hypothetical protein
MAKVGIYLTRGRLADILPKLFEIFGNKPFTESEAKEKIDGFKHGYLRQMYNIGMAVRVEGKSRLYIDRREKTRWMLAPATCEAIEDYYGNNETEGSPKTPEV